MMPSGEYPVPPPPELSGTAVAAALKLLAAREPEFFHTELASYVDRALATFAGPSPARGAA
jgi:hypothetical protein